MRYNILKSCTRLLCTIAQQSVPQVCIVGAGPAGFYAAQQLLRVITYVYNMHIQNRLIIINNNLINCFRRHIP